MGLNFYRSFRTLQLGGRAVFLVFFFFLYSLPLVAAPDGDPNSEAGQDQSKPTNPWGTARNHIIGINPGIAFSNSRIAIEGGWGTAKMVQKKKFDTGEWILDIQSPNVWLSDHVGLNLLFQSRPFNLKYQKYGSSVTTNSEESGGGKTNPYGSEVVGTRAKGHYNMAMPILFIDPDGTDHGFRFGVGYGTSFVSIRSTSILDNTPAYLPLLLSPDRASMIQNLQTTALAMGSVDFRHGDPIFSSLMLHLDEPGGLERMGVYMLGRRKFGTDLTSLFTVFYLTSNQRPAALRLNNLEAFGAASISNITAKYKITDAPSFFVYGEYQWLVLNIRVAVGGPQFKRNGLSYNLTNAMISMSIPFRF